MNGSGRAGHVLTVCATALYLTIGASPAGAEPIRLTVLTGPPFPQTDNRPCIIGDPSCPDSLEYTLIAPQYEDGTLSSPTYTVEQIRNWVGGDTFFVGLDLNQAAGHNGGGVHAGVFQPRGRRNHPLFHERTCKAGSNQYGERLLGCPYRDVQPERIVRRSETRVHRVVQRRNRRAGTILSFTHGKWA